MDVLIPVCRRPHKIPALVESIRATAPRACILFVPDFDDRDEIRAITAAGCEYISSPKWVTYAQKINAGVLWTGGPLLTFAADDLIFQPGWIDAAVAALLHYKCSVAGINDGISRPGRPTHSTHWVVSRDYASRPCIDGSPGPLHEGYRHWYTDDEFIATAWTRGEYCYAEDALVEHHHPCVDPASMDGIYAVGYDHAEADRLLFESREHLWRV